MAKMNMFLHDYTDSFFAIGDTFTKPDFVGAKHSRLRARSRAARGARAATRRRKSARVRRGRRDRGRGAPAGEFVLQHDRAGHRASVESAQADRRGQILLVNASAHFVKEKPKNALTEAGITAVAEAFRAWETRNKLSRVISLDEARAADYNLSPSQFVDVNDRAQHRPLAEILRDLHAAREARERADAELVEVLARLGLNHQEREA